MKKLGLQEQHWIESLRTEWKDLVGEDVAGHTRPGRVIGRTLVVFVDSSVWLSELTRYGREPMLAKIRERFGDQQVNAIRLQIDPDGASARERS